MKMVIPSLVALPAILISGVIVAVAGSDDCDPRDQLPCACTAAGATFSDPEYNACFLGDVNFATKTQVDRLSTRAFIALNWPVARDGDGAVLAGQPDIFAPRAQDWTPVWASWKSTSDIFRGDAPPLGWDAHADTPAACRAVDVEAAMKRHPHADSIPASGAPRLLDEYLNPDGDALIDADGQPVRYDVIFNRQAHDYVVDNRLWDPRGLEDHLDAHGRLDMPSGAWPAGSADPGRRGAVILKTAWKVLSPDDDPDRFHKQWAWITPTIDDGGIRHDCDLRPVGLVGIHIVYKTVLMPEWSWATFEHKAVAPSWDQVGAAAVGMFPSGAPTPDWLFYSNDAPGAARLNARQRNAAAGVPARIVKTYPPGYYFGPVGALGAVEGDCGPANQEFRCLTESIGTIFADSVFRNYVLIGTQWREGDREEGGLLVPEILGNATMETFTHAESSCISCHRHAAPQHYGGNAPAYDFLYSFARDVSGRSIPIQGH